MSAWYEATLDEVNTSLNMLIPETQCSRNDSNNYSNHSQESRLYLLPQMHVITQQATLYAVSHLAIYKYIIIYYYLLLLL